MDEDALERVAERCRRRVLSCGGRRGLTHSDFCARVWTYHELQQEEKFRVLVMLAKMPEIASVLRAWGGREVWHFYASELAPEGAYRHRSPGQIIDDAGRKH